VTSRAAVRTLPAAAFVVPRLSWVLFGILVWCIVVSAMPEGVVLR
jgi:hypothetical protein